MPGCGLFYHPMIHRDNRSRPESLAGQTPAATFDLPPCFVPIRSFLGTNMHKFIAVLAIAAPLGMLPGAGSAKGCLKGAAVGGVVGHVAGHHALIGAAAGCVIEHHREKMKDKDAAQRNSQNRPAGTAPGS